MQAQAASREARDRAKTPEKRVACKLQHPAAFLNNRAASVVGSEIVSRAADGASDGYSPTGLYMAPHQNRSRLRRPRANPSGRVRPTTGRVRGALISMLGPGGAEGKRVLDLYAGTGGLGLEAMRHGAAFAEFVDSDRRCCAEITAEAERLGYGERCRVHQALVERVFGRLEGGYDIVFIDPPYADDPFEEVLARLGEDGSVVNDNATVFAEHGRRRELEERYGRLVRRSVRNYGDTSVTVFRAAAAGGQG